MTALWTAAEAAKATGGRCVQDWQATGVSIDTRTIKPGDLFVALSAARDGHDFVGQALKAGAAAALVSRVPGDVPAIAPLLVVPDVLAALEDLGRTARARTKARVVAVTGSVGKTSTKEMLRAILSGQGRTHCAEASYNNHWGVPLTLARMPAETDYAVIEIGMNHPGEIAPLARMAAPHVALVTTVAPAHLEAFDGIDGIAREKASLFDGLVAGGVAVINADIDTAPILHEAAARAAAREVTFGTAEGADFRVRDIRLQSDASVVQAEAHGEKLLLRIQSPGRHFAMNGLGALAAAEAAGADLALAAGDLGRWTPYRGRGAHETILLDPVETDLTLELIDDSYNANPASMGAALDVLAVARPKDSIGRVAHGRRIAILGDMKELGPSGPQMHAALSRHPAMGTIDVVHCVGPLMAALHDALPEVQRGRCAATAEEMAHRIRAVVDAGDVVLVKGSLSTGLGGVVDAIRKLGHAPADLDKESE